MMNIDMACEAFRKILEEQQERVANMGESLQGICKRI